MTPIADGFLSADGGRLITVEQIPGNSLAAFIWPAGLANPADAAPPDQPAVIAASPERRSFVDPRLRLWPVPD